MIQNHFCQTPCGPIQGTAAQPGVSAFRGIRYASAGRWQYPVVTTGWDGVYDASHFGPNAMQMAALGPRTKDGKILKSSTVFIRDDHGRTVGIFAINYDITILRAMGDTIAEVVGTGPSAPREPEPIVRSVADLLDDLIEQSVQLVGTPVALMTKEEKVRAIRYLNDTGAFLITKSGPKVCKFFGISKYTLYSYLDEAKNGPKE